MKKLIIILTVFTFFLPAVVRANDDVESLKMQIAKLEMQNADLTRRLLEASKPPLQIAQRKAIIGGGYVIQIQNDEAKTLPVQVEIVSPAFQTAKLYDVVLPPAHIAPGIKEIGHLQGWIAAPGDVVTIKAQNYNPLRAQIQD